MSTYNRLDLQTLGCQPISMPKNLSDHWDGASKEFCMLGQNLVISTKAA